MDVSIIIVNYNTEELLQNCLFSLFEKTKGVSFEVIVVDNDSSDDSCSIVKKSFSQVQLIESPANLGFGRANNLGASFAKGKYLFLLNSDTWLRNDAVSILYNFISKNENCAICGANLTDFSDTPQHSYELIFPSIYSHLSPLYRKICRIIFGKNLEYNFSGKAKKVAYITGADMMISRELFLSCGGFDESFFMYYEETELTYRIRKMGYSVYSIPDAQIAHKKGASLAFASETKKIVIESRYIYFSRIYQKPAIIWGHLLFIVYCYYRITAGTLLRKNGTVTKHREMLQLAQDAYKKFVLKTPTK